LDTSGVGAGVLVLLLYIAGLLLSLIAGRPLGDFIAIATTVIVAVALGVSLIVSSGLAKALGLLLVFMLGVATAHLAF